VYSLWIVAINDPGQCASSPCTGKDVLANSEGTKSDVTWGDGTVASADGTAQLTGFVPAGEWTSSWFGNGFTNVEKAEIHLVVNDHGPAIPGRIATMLSSYRDGCTDESLPPPFPATAKNDGQPGPNACALTQDAIFVR
jgi:hypothetical protein